MARLVCGFCFRFPHELRLCVKPILNHYGFRLRAPVRSIPFILAAPPALS